MLAALSPLTSNSTGNKSPWYLHAVFGVSRLTKGGTLYPNKMVNYDPAELTEKRQHKTVINES
jgi:hypothetical protein